MSKLNRFAPLLLLITFTATACEDKPLEEAGENIDDAVEDTVDAVEDAVDDAGDALEDAAEEVDGH